jgi:hypothetical protein
MGRNLKRRLLEQRLAKKNITCRHCGSYIFRGDNYTYSTIIGFWGSYHTECFKLLSVSLETEDTGMLKSNSSIKRLEIDTARQLKTLISTNNNSGGVQGEYK